MKTKDMLLATLMKKAGYGPVAAATELRLVGVDASFYSNRHPGVGKPVFEVGVELYGERVKFYYEDEYGEFIGWNYYGEGH